MNRKNIVTIFSSIAMVYSMVSLPVLATVTPPIVEDNIPPGGSMVVAKEVTTPEIPPVVDVCLLEDETGSFADDIANLQGGTTASDIYDTIIAASPGAQFAVAGFRDYPISPYGSVGDYVYHLHSTMSPVKADWINGINSLSASGGGDLPEAQYDAIVAAAGPGTFEDPTVGTQSNCGWRDPIANPGVQRILVVTTDAPFHVPDGTHMNDQASTIVALNAQNIIVIGLKAPGTGTELDSLAAATGGSVQALSSDGSNIADAVLSGLSSVTTDVWYTISSDPGLNVTLSPAVHYNVPGNSTVNFTETISVDNNSSLEGTTLQAVVTFIANSFPEDGAPIGQQFIKIHIPDVTAPKLSCTETVNPNGKKIPPAGSTTLPGSKGGQNEDGFYQLFAKDNVDTALNILVTDVLGSGPFGPFNSGDKVKITEAPGATPESKNIGSTNGQAGAIVAHITLKGDAVIMATDAAGNVSSINCLVPPPPK